MSALRDAHYDAWRTMVQEMRHYQQHGEWFHAAMLPIRPIKDSASFTMRDQPQRPEWTQVEYGWDSPDAHSYDVPTLMVYGKDTFPADILRGQRLLSLQKWIAPHHAKLRGIASYFFLEQTLGNDRFTVTFYVEKASYANRLFTETIGRG